MLLEQIHGHASALATLRKALANDRVAHAYLFTGPDGIGKRCTAIALAHALLCQEAPQHGCASCPACVSLQAGSHPDYYLSAPLPGKQSMGIDQIRAMQRFLALRPVRGGQKVCILNEAHNLTEQAQSALLKVLEEPPGDAIIVLIAASGATLSLPLLSRCQHVRFAPLPVQDVERILRQEAGLEADTAGLLARYSRGSIGRALSLDPATLVEERQRVVERLSTVQGASFSTLSQLAEWLVADRSSKTKKKTETPAALEQGARLELVLAWYEEALRYLLLGNSAVVRYQDCLPALAQATANVGIARALRDLTLVYETIQALGRNAHPRLTVEDMLLELAEAAPAR